MDNFETNSSVTIDDLKYHELRQTLSYLSVSQLFKYLTVCRKWYPIITELLDSQKVLSLHYNDINHFTNEEMDEKCDNWRHLALRSSVGRVIGKESMIAVFTTPSFQKYGHKFFKLFDLCPNIQSLDLSQYRLQVSDLDILLDYCPLLECVSITSDETNWTKFMCSKVSGLKHFSVSLTSLTPIYGVHEKPIQPMKNQKEIQLENLVIMRPQLNITTLTILSSYLESIASVLKKFHFVPAHKMTQFEALHLITSLASVESNQSVVKDLNLNVFVFNELYETLNNILPNLETLYLHFSIEIQENDSLKKLKNLRKLHLDFNSNVKRIFAFEVSLWESDNQYINLLPKIPATLEKLTIFDAFLSIKAFIQTSNYLPKLQELKLIDVIIDSDCEQCFWRVISNFKSLRSLTLNGTDISDVGIEHLTSCDSLQILELVKYKGPNEALPRIDSIKVIEVFGQLACLHPNKWFDLRLDIDVFEVTNDIKRLVPRNLRLVNVGYKK